MSATTAPERGRVTLTHDTLDAVTAWVMATDHAIGLACYSGEHPVGVACPDSEPLAVAIYRPEDREHPFRVVEAIACWVLAAVVDNAFGAVLWTCFGFVSLWGGWSRWAAWYLRRTSERDADESTEVGS